MGRPDLVIVFVGSGSCGALRADLLSTACLYRSTPPSLFLLNKPSLTSQTYMRNILCTIEHQGSSNVLCRDRDVVGTSKDKIE